MVYKYDGDPLVGEISDYNYREELLLHKVDETKWEALWNKLVSQYHYLGYISVIGARIKYLITLGIRIVGAISFCSAAYQLGPRDEYIGWDEETRLNELPHVVNNNRFLILPNVHIRNLASRVLSMSIRKLREDWEEQYEVVPYIVETFVDRETYFGTCYRASNWTYLGNTKGYGKVGKSFIYHGQKKDIYVYIMDRQFARRYKPDILRVTQLAEKLKVSQLLKKEKGEIAAMMNGTPMWYPSLLKEAGVHDNPVEQIQSLFVDHIHRYMPFLGRSEQKQHFIAMLQGLLSDLPRKSIEPIAQAFEGADCVRKLVNFMSTHKWDDAGMAIEYQTELSEHLTVEDGMITGDETGYAKKGKESVGVARQYCGRLGKVDNCQVGVAVGYASSAGYGLINQELYIPKSWYEDENKNRRDKCDLPAKVKFRTKNEILLDMIIATDRSGKFPAKYVGVDSAYGGDSKFLDSLPSHLIYFADVPCDCKVFASRPDVFLPKYSGKGRIPTIMQTSFASVEVKELVMQSDTSWNTVVLGIGAKGPVITEDKILRVVEVRDGLPGKDVWLYVRKLENGDIKYSLCNAPANATVEEIRKPALMRWPIEQCFKECKKYLGMGQYETRSWISWHRHMLLTRIAHLFVIKLRMKFSSTPRTPGVTPYINTPVEFKAYTDAFNELNHDLPITNPYIFAMPTSPQQFMTIGIIQKLISSSFIKVGDVMKCIDISLYHAHEAFKSHSISKMNRTLLAKPS